MIEWTASGDSKPFSLYLHIPFCCVRCTYCAFNTYANAEKLIPAYVAAMCNELHWLGQATPRPVHTVYFGGGTPSLLTPEQVAAILETCRRGFALAPEAEISLEANPGSLDLAYLEQLREAGINRLSIGMQSAQADELKFMGRDHTVEAVPQAVEAARRAGFDNLNLDLIFGLPHQTLESWLANVRAALALRPDHLSMYALELEEKTAITRNIERGRLPMPDDDLAATMYEAADALASEAGLVQYEISNWARPGFECAHNLQYWQNEPYLGVGAGASGYAAQIRYDIVRPIRRYVELASAQGEVRQFPLTDSVAYSESIDHATAMLEHMLTGLRLVQKGVNVEGFRHRFGLSLDEVYGQAIERLTRDGLLRREAGHVRLTAAARLISNRVFLQFI